MPVIRRLGAPMAGSTTFTWPLFLLNSSMRDTCSRSPSPKRSRLLKQRTISLSCDRAVSMFEINSFSEKGETPAIESGKCLRSKYLSMENSGFDVCVPYPARGIDPVLTLVNADFISGGTISPNSQPISSCDRRGRPRLA